jgi:hypothetical protein
MVDALREVMATSFCKFCRFPPLPQSECVGDAPIGHVQRWPVSKRVNSSKADADDPTLIEPVQVAVA